MLMIDSKKGSTILNYYNGSFIRALTKLYPELTLKRSNFFHKKGKLLLYFKNGFIDYTGCGLVKLDERRKFFDEFAKSMNFDPLDDEKWYCISKKDIMHLAVS
jgi:hypothetical protein